MNDWWWSNDDADYSGIEEGQRLLREAHRVCCQDESGEPYGEWSMHSDDWTHSYPPEASADAGVPGVCVEVSVRLDVRGATTLWLWDSETYVTSHEYGGEVLYPDEPDEEEREARWAEWLARLQAQIGGAAEAAWNSDALSCSECGYHYNTMEGPCCGDHNSE